ncbi:hypothetical protein ACSSS7_001928 [Eimeria intestinalis]
MASNTRHESPRRRPSRSQIDGVWRTAQIRHSDAFESFYAGQQLVPAEEWDAFLTSLQADLPTVFRVVTITPHRHHISKFLKQTMDRYRYTLLGGQVDSWREYVSLTNMCAAPGSKTSQLLEALHKAAERERPREIGEADGWPVLPSGSRESGALGAPSHEHSSAQKAASKPLTPVLFDGVLCDVPCSGDGTLRKKRSLWASWSAHHGLGCHRLQVQILLRGIKLCKVGSRIVYSTWRVKWEGRWYDSFEEIPKTGEAVKKIRPSMFPPGRSPEADGVPLRRCMRFFPHVNDTGGFFVAVMRKIRDIPLNPIANKDSKVEPLGGASGHAASEMACTVSAPHRRHDRRDCEEEFLASENESAAYSSLRRPRPKRFDQMQLDMVCLDWHSGLLKQQYQQIIQQAERLARDGKEQDLAGTTDNLRGARSGTTGVASVDCTGQQAPSLPLALTRSVLKQTTELVFRTLDLPEHILTCSDALSDLRGLLSDLGSLLCSRLKTSEGCRSRDPDAPAGGEQLEAGERHPRRVYLVSKGVKRILESTGRSRYKVISGGCLAFHARYKGIYRATYGGAQWLASFYERALRLIVGQNNALGSPTNKSPQSGVDDEDSAAPVSAKSRRVFRVPSELLYRLVGTDQDQRRVDLRDVEELQCGQIVSRESTEGPLLFLTVLAPVEGASNTSSTKIAVPAWRGRTNVELMLDRETRYALKSLMDELSTVAKGQDPGCVETCPG